MKRHQCRSSAYMHWAKTHAQIRYHLASSGLKNLSMQDVHITPDDLNLTSEEYYGHQPLKNAIAEKEGVEPSNVFPTLGTSLANHIALAAILDRGDEILVEHPTYELILSTASYLGVKVRRFPRRPENHFAIDTDDIRKKISSKTRLIILTNLNNPSSAYSDEETLKRIGNFAKRAGARVLVDEIYLDALFDTNHRSAVHLGPEFISTNSLTKIYGLSGLRCGWVLAPKDVIKRMFRLIDLFYVNLPHPTEQLSVKAFHSLPRIQAFARSILTENHSALNALLDGQQQLQRYSPPYGTVSFLRLLSGSITKLTSLLRDKFATSIAPGKFFEMPNYFRIGLGRQPEEFREGLNRIREALELLDTRRRQR